MVLAPPMARHKPGWNGILEHGSTPLRPQRRDLDRTHRPSSRGGPTRLENGAPDRPACRARDQACPAAKEGRAKNRDCFKGGRRTRARKSTNAFRKSWLMPELGLAPAGCEELILQGGACRSTVKSFASLARRVDRSTARITVDGRKRSSLNPTFYLRPSTNPRVYVSTNVDPLRASARRRPSPRDSGAGPTRSVVSTRIAPG